MAPWPNPLPYQPCLFSQGSFVCCYDIIQSLLSGLFAFQVLDDLVLQGCVHLAHMRQHWVRVCTGSSRRKYACGSGRWLVAFDQPNSMFHVVAFRQHFCVSGINGKCDGAREIFVRLVCREEKAVPPKRRSWRGAAVERWSG